MFIGVFSKMKKKIDWTIKIYVLRNRQILFRKSHCAISKWRKSAVLSKTLLTMLLFRVFISTLLNAMAGFCENFSILSGDLKRSDVFCSASSTRGWGSWSSGSRSAGIHRRLFELVEECRGPQRRQPSNGGSRELELAEPLGQDHAVTGKPGPALRCISQGVFREQLHCFREL